MLAAILLNPFAPPPEELNVSGQLFGSVGTSWNRTWAEEYGPDVDKARKAGKEEVQIAIKALQQAPELEPIEEAQEIAKRSLAADLMRNDEDRIAVLTAYYAYQRRKKKQNDIAAILLLS